MEEIKKEIIEKVILVAVADQDVREAEESLDELEELVKTAGAVVAARVIQVREAPHPGTYIGKGKIDEVKALLYGTDAIGIVCDDELSPAQMGNLSDALDTKVMDRTLIILDIFAKRAFTREGKIQVELAQLKYRASKLTGQGKALSRLGGGIGTRGPGEKKLEMDRRLIRTRISRLKAELRDVVKHREVQRKQRQKNHSVPLQEAPRDDRQHHAGQGERHQQPGTNQQLQFREIVADEVVIQIVRNFMRQKNVRQP